MGIAPDAQITLGGRLRGGRGRPDARKDIPDTLYQVACAPRSCRRFDAVGGNEPRPAYGNKPGKNPLLRPDPIPRPWVSLALRPSGHGRAENARNA